MLWVRDPSSERGEWWRRVSFKADQVAGGERMRVKVLVKTDRVIWNINTDCQ